MDLLPASSSKTHSPYLQPGCLYNCLHHRHDRVDYMHMPQSTIYLYTRANRSLPLSAYLSLLPFTLINFLFTCCNDFPQTRQIKRYSVCLKKIKLEMSEKQGNKSRPRVVSLSSIVGKVKTCVEWTEPLLRCLLWAESQEDVRGEWLTLTTDPPDGGTSEQRLRPAGSPLALASRNSWQTPTFHLCA